MSTSTSPAQVLCTSSSRRVMFTRRLRPTVSKFLQYRCRRKNRFLRLPVTHPPTTKCNYYLPYSNVSARDVSCLSFRSVRLKAIAGMGRSSSKKKRLSGPGASPMVGASAGAGVTPRQSQEFSSRSSTGNLVQCDPKVYKKLPNIVRNSVDGGAVTEENFKSVVNFDKDHPLAQVGLKPLSELPEFESKTVVLDGLPLTAWRRPRGTHTRRKVLSTREKRKRGIGHFPKGQQRYELYLPLHDLWQQYMTDLLSLNPGSKPQVIESKLLKADYHGCLVTVARSRCPSFVGITGIILQEKQNVFKIVTPENWVKVVPKAHSVFTFELGGFHMTLIGNQLCCRASERSAKKFKAKPTMDL